MSIREYECEMFETITRKVKYTVSAESVEEAEKKLCSGETVKEEPVPFSNETVDRTMIGDPTIKDAVNSKG